MSGAIDYKECPNYRPANLRTNKCKCEVCSVCGFHKHDAIHGPLYGAPPGSKPWGHEHLPAETEPMTTARREGLR